MKKLLFMYSLLLLSPFFAVAQTSDYKVVFDLTSKDSVDQVSAIRWVGEVAKADPASMIEVVMYGKGIYMATKDKSFVSQNLQDLAKQKNISFKVCEVAMKNLQVDKSQLLAGVQMVPDGIKEIIDKQHAGWGYIKVSH